MNHIYSIGSSNIILKDSRFAKPVLFFFKFSSQTCKVCRRTTKDINKSEESEYKKFQKSQKVGQIVNDVSSRLGFEQPLPLEKVLDMYEMCRYEQAYNVDKPSAWCTV